MLEYYIDKVVNYLSVIDKVWYILICVLIEVATFVYCLIKGWRKIFAWVSVANFLLLTCIAVLMHTQKYYLVSLATLTAFFYFVLFLVIYFLPMASIVNNKLRTCVKVVNDRLKREYAEQKYSSKQNKVIENFALSTPNFPLKELKTFNPNPDCIGEVNLNHAKSLAERLSYYDLSEVDRLVVSNINKAILDAELNRSSVEGLNDKLSSLVKIMAKYDA